MKALLAMRHAKSSWKDPATDDHDRPLKKRGRDAAPRMGRLLVVVGLIIAGLGALVMLGLPIGRLPGDIVVRRGNSTFYFPLVTCLVVSVVLSIVMAILRR